MPDTPWSPETWHQRQFRGGQRGCEGNYGPAAGKSFSHSSELATECSPSDKISLNDMTTTAGPSPDHRGSLRCSLMRRSSSLNDSAEQLEVFSANTTAASVPKFKRLSLPCLPVLVVPEMNISELTPEEKDADIQGFFKDGDQVEAS